MQIRGDDPTLRYVYGYSLAVSGKYQDAEVQLRKAIELDAVFAAPYNQLRRKDVEERVRVLASKSNE